MGINVYAERVWKEEPEKHRLTELTSCDGAWRQTKVEISPSNYAGRPNEVFLSCDMVDLKGDRDLAFHPTELRVRIHGRTVVALMDALIENPDMRRYLASGVEFFRSKEAQEKDA